jgi:hypothetical protein
VRLWLGDGLPTADALENGGDKYTGVMTDVEITGVTTPLAQCQEV